MTRKDMIVAGVMSGTSADGINVALVRFQGVEGSKAAANFRSTARRQERPRHMELLGHAEYAYPRKVREAILAAMNASSANVADLSRLNFLLGELYADAILATAQRCQLKPDLVGCHGQTLYHQGKRLPFLGRKVAATWQTGEAAIVAERLGVPVVSDFRAADMAAGGKGAPLVPCFDHVLFRDAHIGRIVQNIGGIANLTAIPAGASANDVIAFDTGPGNMVIDAVTEKLFHRPFDRDGRIAASGKVLDKIVMKFLQRDFFRQKPPKTAGREEFGREFVAEFLRSCHGAAKKDAVATAAALTAKSIADALTRHVLPNTSSKRRSARRSATFHEMIVSGGGAKNSTLMSMLANELSALGLRLRFTDDFGLPSAAKEATAFALLAFETWHRRPSNLPSATGAKRPAVLGKISCP
jgi:anhydro-N-acetylmuramic acid kinase